jgi:CRISPR-associated protein Cmr6
MAAIDALPLAKKNVTSYLKRELVEKMMQKMKEVKEQRAGKGVGPEDLRRWLSDLVYKIAQRLSSEYSKEKAMELIREAEKTVDESMKALEELGYVKVMDSNFVTLTPLAIGLRNPYMEPLEVSISWDPYINLPYIPATSLKGAVASLAWMNNSKLYDLLSKKDEASPIIFLDAYPVEILNKGLLALDIINPHYREVEGRISEPESRPTPLRFLVVSRGVAFRIIVYVARRWLTPHRPLDLEGLRSLIMDTLSRGIGAKTSIGYGRFKTK